MHTTASGNAQMTMTTESNRNEPKTVNSNALNNEFRAILIGSRGWLMSYGNERLKERET
jgi:hypothetical protein